MDRKPMLLDDVEAAVDAILARVGPRVVIGMPLGLGKPVELINALYRRAVAEPALQLKILTALSLELPTGGSRLENAFLKPFVARVFAGVPQLDYMRALRDGSLPANVEVCEFFFKPGSLLGNRHAQQHYISSNYSHAARDVFNQGCNVAAQLVCRRDTPEGPRYSQSCNPDTAPELIQLLQRSGRPHVVVGLVNQNLPYMENDAEVGPETFDLVVAHPRYDTPLFSTPKLAVTTPDYCLGLQASALIRDGGTLQVGIGALGDAVVYASLLRHQHPEDYAGALRAGGALDRSGALIEALGGTGPFVRGLYGASEMFVDGFLHLYRAGILKRRVYDFWALQQLINEGRCDPDRLQPGVLDDLEALGLRVIRTQDFRVLQHHGFFNDATRYELGHLIAPDGTRVIANVADPQARRVMGEQCLGTRLRRGILLHAGFFLGPRDFYAGLKEMPDEERRGICMTGVDKVNQLDLNPRLYQQQRVHARFINTGILATLSGAIVSDGLDDGRVISGVGGQYNFVAMAHQLQTGRSVLMVRAVREQDGKPPSSNVVLSYGHCTIPRHLRDIVITEYGIAELRSKTDNEVAKALICIADSRFQGELIAQAQKSGKIEAGWQVPEAWRRNLPATLEAQLAPFRARGQFPAFPLGCEFTPQELALGEALKKVKAWAAERPKWQLLLGALRAGEAPAAARPALAQLGLETPQTMEDRVVRSLLIEALRASAA